MKTKKILEIVIDYLKDPCSPEWEKKIGNFDPALCYEVMSAANRLSVHSLLNLANNTLKHMIKGKTPEELRKIFNIKNDFTPEEEENVNRQWCEF